ncbi:MAG: zf-HC2 domain-containing protein [Jatrophihabitans sp.]
MNCERIREAASARLDGEPVGMSIAVLDAHLTRCVGCARWLTGVETLARSTRISAAGVPDLSDQILRDVALPAVRVRRRVTVLRVALCVVGVIQFAVAAPAVFGDSMAMSMSLHASHESAAWNAALGAAFLATALRPRRASGLLPMLVAFVGVLAALSIRDLIAGGVSPWRLCTHIGCVLGLMLVAVLARRDADTGAPLASALPETSAQPSDPPGLRGVA